MDSVCFGGSHGEARECYGRRRIDSDPRSCGRHIAYQEATHWQAASNWIVGVEADFQASGENANGTTHQNASQLLETAFSSGAGTAGEFTANSSQSISHNDSLLWFGTVRGRVGYAIWPTLMLYSAGGLAYGRLNESVSASFSAATTVVSGNPPTSVTANFPSGTNLVLPFSVSQAGRSAAG